MQNATDDLGTDPSIYKKNRHVEACDIIWMDVPRICSGNTLEMFEVRDVAIEPDDDCADDEVINECLDFLFPFPEAQTAVHHFSRLKYLKLHSLKLCEWDIDENISLESLGIDEKRMEIAFPELRGLVLHHPTPGVSRSLAQLLLRFRAPYIESLHLACDQSGMGAVFFPNLAELCLSAKEEDTMAWLDYFDGKVKSMDKTKTGNPWHLDKLCVSFGDVTKWKGRGKLNSIAKAVEMTLYPPRKRAFKHISFQFVIPLGEKIRDSYLTQVMEQIITGLRGIISKGVKLDGHFSMFLELIFKCNLDKCYDTPQRIAKKRLMSSEVGKELCDSRLPYWINEISDKVAFEISTRNFKINASEVAKSLSTWESKYHQIYSTLRKRHRKDRLNLCMTSRNWDYCMSKGYWEVSCPTCNMSGRTFSCVGNDAWAVYE